MPTCFTREHTPARNLAKEVLCLSPVKATAEVSGAGTLLFFKETKIVDAAEALDWPRTLTMLGDDVVLWRGNEVQVLDANGQLLWSVEFSKSIAGVAAHGDTLAWNPMPALVANSRWPSLQDWAA